MSGIRKDVAGSIVNVLRATEECKLMTLFNVIDAAKSSVVQALRRLTALGIVKKNDVGTYSLNEAYFEGFSWREVFKQRVPRTQKNTSEKSKPKSLKDLRESAKASRVLAEKMIEACDDISTLEQEKADLITQMNEKIADLDYKIGQARRLLAKIESGQIDDIDEVPEHIKALDDFNNKGPVDQRSVRVLVDNKAGATMLTPTEVAGLTGMGTRR